MRRGGGERGARRWGAGEAPKAVCARRCMSLPSRQAHWVHARSHAMPTPMHYHDSAAPASHPTLTHTPTQACNGHGTGRTGHAAMQAAGGWPRRQARTSCHRPGPNCISACLMLIRSTYSHGALGSGWGWGWGQGSAGATAARQHSSHAIGPAAGQLQPACMHVRMRACSTCSVVANVAHHDIPPPCNRSRLKKPRNTHTCYLYLLLKEFHFLR